MFAVTIESLPGDDDDDTGDISICDIQDTDDEVAEIFRKHISWLHHIIYAQIHDILCEQFRRLDTTISHIMSYIQMLMRLKNIWYFICFDNRDSLPGDDDGDDDTCDMSTCDMQPTDDEVAEIFRQQVTL